MIRHQTFKSKDTEEYLNAVKSIVPTNTLWLSIKTKSLVQRVTVDSIAGYALVGGPVITLQGMDWNGMLATSRIDPNDGFHEEPQFEVPAVSEVRIGTFEESYKKGRVAWPLDDYSDYSNNPIVLIKA